MTLNVEQISFSYVPDTPVLRDVTFGAGPGEILLIVGRNGAGKSTLLKLLNGILRPDRGSIIMENRETGTLPTSTIAATLCVTFQNPSDQLFASSVGREVLFGPSNLRRSDAEGLTSRALSLLGMSDLSETHPYDLNAAQRKLLTIASAIATDAPILAFDEPTVFLSQPERAILSTALSNLVRAGRTILAVSHDLSFFLPVAKRVIVLEGGAVSFNGTVHDLWASRNSLRPLGVRFPLAWRLKPHVGLDPLAACQH